MIAARTSAITVFIGAIAAANVRGIVQGALTTNGPAPIPIPLGPFPAVVALDTTVIAGSMIATNMRLCDAGMTNKPRAGTPHQRHLRTAPKRRARCRTAALRLMVASVVLAPCLTHAQASALIVDGEVETRLTLSLDDLRAMRHQTGEVDDQGRRATYDGVPLTEILRRAGVAIGRAPLRGNALTSVVIITGLDGFRAVFALAELDPASIDQRVLLADRRDGQPLSASEGPLRVVAPGDKYPARWVRHVVRLTVAGVASPKPGR